MDAYAVAGIYFPTPGMVQQMDVGVLEKIDLTEQDVRHLCLPDPLFHPKIWLCVQTYILTEPRNPRAA
jgi:hypothetical protein